MHFSLGGYLQPGSNLPGALRPLRHADGEAEGAIERQERCGVDIHCLFPTVQGRF